MKECSQSGDRKIGYNPCGAAPRGKLSNVPMECLAG